MTEETKLRHLFTAAEAETWLGIPAATVRTWAYRQKIWAFGLTEAGKPMYDRNHLVALREVRKSKLVA